MTDPEPASASEPAAACPPLPRRPRAVRARPAPLVTWRAGVHLSGTRLWCDALRTHDVCFVSWAQAAGRRGRRTAGTLLCTERTLRLRQALGEQVPAAESVLLSPTGRPFHLGSLRLELFPSGQGPGAASLWVKLPSGECVVYAGAPCAQPEADAEPMQARAAATLVCAAPLAALPGALPARADALAALRALVEAGRAAGAVTVILCTPLPGAPAIFRELSADGVAAFAHPAIQRTLRAYQQLGLLPAPSDAAPRRFGRPLAPGSVLLWPAAAPLPPAAQLRGAAARELRVILGIGAALAESAVAAARAALPAGVSFAGAVALADGLDRPALLRYLADSESRRVYLTAGYSDSLAAAARALGVRVEPLGPPHQLPLFGAS